MPISMTQRAPQMPAEAYEQIIANVGPPLCGADGFISHAAEITTDGVTVTEVWESREHWERWFNTAIRPHLPDDAPEPTVTELHNALGR
jgi:heme-degrading monooxygenase HmoA